MSDKIWNGMILRNHSLEQSLLKLQHVRRVCLPKLKNAVEDRVAELLVFEADLTKNLHLLEHVAIEALDVRALIANDKHAVLIEESVGQDWDFTFSVSLIPKGNDVLLLHHIWNDPEYEDALIEVGFEDYHYQNQTDRPDRVPEDEWEHRRNDWYQYYYGALDEAQAEPFFNYTIIHWHDIHCCPSSFDKEKIRATVPSDFVRRRRVAQFLMELEAAISCKGRFNAWHEIEKRMSEVILCQNEDIILATMLRGIP